MALKFFEKLSTDFTELLNNDNDYDVIVEVGEAPLNKEYKLHSLILKARCPLIAEELKEVRVNGIFKQLSKPNISVDIFDIILKYIYGGIFSLDTLEKSILFDLLVSANELDLKELTNSIQQFLIENHSNWLRLNFSRVLRTSFENSKLEKLKEFCNNIVAKHPSIVFDSEDFVSFPEDALVSIIENDNLQMEELQIWENMIQWGKAQNKSLPNRIEQWSNNNFTALKNTLQKLLPHIRYFQIPHRDLVTKVKPYLQAFDPRLWDEILCKIVDPSYPISVVVLPPRTRISMNKESLAVYADKELEASVQLSLTNSEENRENEEEIFQNAIRLSLLDNTEDQDEEEMLQEAIRLSRGEETSEEDKNKARGEILENLWVESCVFLLFLTNLR